MCINSTEWIIQEVYICILIKRTCKLNALLLSTTQSNTSFSYFCEITIWKHLKVFYYGTSSKHLLISKHIHGGPIQNVFLYRPCLDPGCLRNICFLSLNINLKTGPKALLRTYVSTLMDAYR